MITLPKFEPAEVPKIGSQADVSLVTQHLSNTRLDDDNSSMGSGLLHGSSGNASGYEAASLMSSSRASHSSSLGAYVEREGPSGMTQTLEQ